MAADVRNERNHIDMWDQELRRATIDEFSTVLDRPRVATSQGVRELAFVSDLTGSSTVNPRFWYDETAAVFVIDGAGTWPPGELTTTVFGDEVIVFDSTPTEIIRADYWEWRDEYDQSFGNAAAVDAAITTASNPTPFDPLGAYTAARGVQP